MQINAYLGIGIVLIFFGLMNTMSIVDVTPALITQNSMSPKPNTEYTYLDMIQVLCYDPQGVKIAVFEYAKNGEASQRIIITFAGHYSLYDAEWEIWNKELEDPIDASGNYTFAFTVTNGALLETEFTGNFSIGFPGEQPPDEIPPEDVSEQTPTQPIDADYTPTPSTGWETSTVFFLGGVLAIVYGFVKQKKVKT